MPRIHQQSTSLSHEDSRRILFLVTETDDGPGNDNHLLLPQTFRHLGWHTDIMAHDAWQQLAREPRYKLAHDLLWPIGFGPRHTYNARLQALSRLPEDRFISPPQAVHALHSKRAWLAHCPTTRVSDSAAELQQFWQTQAAHLQWVLKPEAGSYGAGVILLSRQTDPQAIHTAMRTKPGSWLLQRYLPGIMQGEKRTLVCGGQIIDAYLRLPTRGFKANLSAAAAPVALTNNEPTSPKIAAREAATLDAVVQRLGNAGIGFAAVDTCEGYLIEVNVANPGGLSTLNTLHGHAPDDPKSTSIAGVEAMLRQRHLS